MEELENFSLFVFCFFCEGGRNALLMTSGPETIKLLLKAEEEASALVEQARKGTYALLLLAKDPLDSTQDRESRLKQASKEAQKEINAYREEKEREYQEELKKVRM